ILYLRHRSLTGIPASNSFSIATIWLSVFLLLIAELLERKHKGNSTFRLYYFRGVVTIPSPASARRHLQNHTILIKYRYTKKQKNLLLPLTWQVKMAFMPRFIGPRRKAPSWQNLSVSY